MSVFVVTDNPDIARAVAPLLAANLYHPRRFSDVLHVERAEHDGVFGFDIAVAVDNRVIVERGFFRP